MGSGGLAEYTKGFVWRVEDFGKKETLRDDLASDKIFGIFGFEDGLVAVDESSDCICGPLKSLFYWWCKYPFESVWDERLQVIQLVQFPYCLSGFGLLLGPLVSPVPVVIAEFPQVPPLGNQC